MREDKPLMGRRPYDREIGLVIAIVVTRHGYIAVRTPLLDLRHQRRLLPPGPVTAGRIPDREICQAIAVVVTGHRLVSGGPKGVRRKDVGSHDHHKYRSRRRTVSEDGELGLAITVVVAAVRNIAGHPDSRT